jgi:hypothetical protein
MTDSTDEGKKLNAFVGSYPPPIWEPLPTREAVFYLMSDMAHIAGTLDKVACREHTLCDDNVLAFTMASGKRKKDDVVYAKKYVKPNGIGALNVRATPPRSRKKSKRAGKKAAKSVRVHAAG